MAVVTSSEGTSWEMGMAARMTAAWRMAESDELTAKPKRRKTKDEAEEECVEVAGGHRTEGKQLV